MHTNNVSLNLIHNMQSDIATLNLYFHFKSIFKNNISYTDQLFQIIKMIKSQKWNAIEIGIFMVQFRKFSVKHAGSGEVVWDASHEMWISTFILTSCGYTEWFFLLGFHYHPCGAKLWYSHTTWINIMPTYHIFWHQNQCHANFYWLIAPSFSREASLEVTILRAFLE